jgi:PHD/YefM family antitoxin component YafN of YafNO toxin-antitoxin module
VLIIIKITLPDRPQTVKYQTQRVYSTPITTLWTIRQFDLYNRAGYFNEKDLHMITVTSEEFQQHLERYEDEALRQPTTITLNGETRLVMISFEEYRRLKRRDRRVLRAEDFTDADIAAIANTEMDPRHRHLDDELE